MTGGGAYQQALDGAYTDPFRKETGIKVTNDPALSYAKIKSMVDAGHTTVDLIPAEGFWAVQQCGKLLEPLDTSIVKLDSVDPTLKESACGAPLLTYTSTIFYNTETYKGAEKPTGCRDFFDVKKFPGKRSANSGALPNALIECALIADGVARDALYPLDIDRAMRKIMTIRDSFALWNSGADSAQFMAAGEVDMILAWNGRAYDAIEKQRAKFAPAYGESFLVYDALVVPKGVKDKKLAMKLVAYMMDPVRQAKMTTLLPYSPSNKDAKLVNLPAGLKDYLPETSPKVAEGVIVQQQKWWAENADKITAAWEKVFNG